MEQEFRKMLAHNIKVERVKRDLTQEQLAELSEISTKHITKIENANVAPSAYLVFKIAKAMNVSIDKLFTKEEL